MNIDTEKKETVGIFNTVKNKRVIELLVKQGKNVIKFPEIQTEKVEREKNQRGILRNLKDFDWLIFTDVFAVDYFFQDLEETDFDLFDLDDLKICACGEAVSDRLRFAQIHSDVVARYNNPEKVFSEIFDYAQNEKEFFDSKFLIFGRRDKSVCLAKTLSEKKLSVVDIENYLVKELNIFETAKFKTLLTNEAVDRLIFTAPEDWESLIVFAYTDSQNLPSAMEIEATDEITAQTLRENNFIK